MRHMENPKKLFCITAALIVFVLSGVDSPNAGEEGGKMPPTITQPAQATPSLVTGTTAALSALAHDDRGERGLTYTWSVTSKPVYAMPPVTTVRLIV